MAIESILGDQSESQTNKQSNVTEFSSQQPKGQTASSKKGNTPNQDTSNTTGSASTANTGMGDNPSGGTMNRGTGMGSTGTGGTGAATATARSLIDQAKETAGQAYEAVTDKAATKLDEQKSTLTEGLSTVANSVRQVGENLGSSRTESGLAEAAAKYTNTAAQKLEDVAGYFETRNVRDMARDLEGYARRNPAVFLGAAFGLGFLAARFLKSTNPGYNNNNTNLAGQDFASAGANTGSNLGSTTDF